MLIRVRAYARAPLLLISLLYLSGSRTFDVGSVTCHHLNLPCTCQLRTNCAALENHPRFISEFNSDSPSCCLGSLMEVSVNDSVLGSILNDSTCSNIEAWSAVALRIPDPCRMASGPIDLTRGNFILFGIP